MKKTFQILSLLALLIAIAGCSSEGGPDDSAVTNIAPGSEEQVIFDGSYATVVYTKAFEADGVSGCFYIDLQAENRSESEIWVYLEDVYVDGLSCATGTGLPVTVLPEKKASGSFIVFYDGELSAVEAVEFKIVIADNETVQRLETSDAIEISPNK